MQMKPIVYAVPADLGSGAAHCVHVVKMAAALRRLGIEVDLCVKSSPPDEVLAVDFDLPRDFSVTRIALSGLGPLSFQFAQGVLARHPTDARVLTRNLVTACLAALRGYKTILELHSPPTTLREHILLRSFMKARSCVGLVTITEALRLRFIEDLGQKAGQCVHVLPDAADPVELKYNATSGVPVVGYVGSFLPGKGADLVLRIAERMPEVRFIMIGGPEADLPLGTRPPNLTLTGRLPHSQAVRMMNHFDVALLPNQDRVLVSGGKADIGRWTSPLKLFEYMSCRRPIVASRLSVLQEVVSDRFNALLADPLDANDWVGKIRELLDRRDFALKLAENAYRDFISMYSWDARARRMAEIFQNGQK